MKKKFSVYGPGGIRVTFDHSEIVWDNPGDGTPEMVYLFTASGTLTAAQNEGELICGSDPRRLTDAQCEWLNGDEVAQAQQRFWDEAEAAKQAAK
jgi:hypothetical protein